MLTFSKHLLPLFLVVMAVLSGLVGCDGTDLAHRKSVAELNKRASELLASGDAAGAASRLEAAKELAPDNPLLQYNLAIAYQQAGQTEKAIDGLTQFLKDHPGHEQSKNALQTVTVLHQQAGDKAMAALAQLEDNSEQPASQSETATPALTEAEARKLAVEHYQEALRGLQTLREGAAEADYPLIDDNIDYVAKALAKAQGQTNDTLEGNG